MSGAAAPGAEGSLRGRTRAAALMRALGEDAGPVWSALTPQEAQLIAGEMHHLPPDNPGSAERTLAALLEDGGPRRDRPGEVVTPGSVWHRLEQVPPRQLAVFLTGESAQACAVILSRISPDQAGATVRAMPETKALEILHRMVALSSPPPAVLAAIEAGVERFLTSGPGVDGGLQRVAEIIEAMGEADGPRLLDRFTASGATAADSVRELLVPFDAIADFSPAGLQTLIAAVNHDTLALALKGASAKVAEAVFANMTQRAGTVLREDMEALGQVPRKDVERARAEMVTLARDLIGRGDIRPAQAREDEDLVE